ncbi:MAG: electron transfer flavoprotein subunit beta/FixA family protein [Thermosulfidibacteraceae bacterium]|jgi:electron transfer flavoprotein beta subunit
MKAVCFVKSVPDTETRVRLTGNRLDKSEIKYILNPYCEFAVEEAVRKKEAGIVDEVLVISMGPSRAQEAIRSALAIGADRGVHIEDDNLDGSDAIVTARVLVEAFKKEGGLDNYQILLFGLRAIDGDTWSVPSMIAELLGIPAVTNIVKLDINGNKAIAVRMVEGGEEVFEVELPCVFAARKGLNEPRYPSLPSIMKAKKKPITRYTISDLGIPSDAVGKVGSFTEVLEYTLPPQRQAGKKVEGEPEQVVEELIKFLREVANII